MSRSRYDRDDEADFQSGYSRGGREDYRSGRVAHGRERAAREMDFGYDDSYGARGATGRSASWRDEDYGRGRYGERADYDYDEPRYSGYRGGATRDYERDEDDGRSLYEEGRDYLRRTFAGRRGRRGTSRSRVRCRDIMTRDVTVATRDTTLDEVARMMKEEDTGVIPVVEAQDNPKTTDTTVEEATRVNTRIYGNGKLVGLITDRDIVIRAVAEGKDCRTTRAEEVMTTDVHTAKPNDRVLDAIRTMGDKQVRRIPVVGDNGNLRGIISMADIALETEEDRELAEALEEISSGASFWSRVFG